jgi:GxxExxY protein
MTTECTEATEKNLTDCSDDLVEQTIGAALSVHRELGPGLLESVYEKALAFELSERGIAFNCQVDVPAIYRGSSLGLGFRADIIVENCLLLEIKAVEGVSSNHLAQTMTYLKLLGYKRGLILNFNERLLKTGIKRVSI